MAEVSVASPERSVRCPRCGYDQRGIITLWNDACPLEGVCSECGLTFRWRNVFRPDNLPPWCVEADGSLWSFPRRVLTTLAMTALPWRLWRGIRMDVPPRWSRLFAYHLSLLLLFYFVFAMAMGLSAVTLQRPSAVSTSGITTVNSSVTALDVFKQAALTPWSSLSPGTYTVTNSSGFVYTNTYFAPIDHAGFLLKGLIRMAWYPPGVLLCCGVAFAALPISRRVAKVRWTHIIRVVMYSYGLFWLALTMFVLHRAIAASGNLASQFEFVTTLCWIVLPVLLYGFWWAAATRYLRMQHGWIVALSLLIIGFLMPLSLGQILYSLSRP